MKDLIYKDGHTLIESEKLKVAELDSQIPRKFDSSGSFHNAQERLQDYTKLMQIKGFFKVVYYADTLVGFHLLGQAQQENTITVISLWTHPSYRKMGIAMSLKKMGIAWAKSCGYKFMNTTVHANNLRMLEINKKNGFKDYSINLRLEL